MQTPPSKVFGLGFSALIIGSVAFAGVAQGDTVVPKKCSSDGHVLNATASYTLTSTQHLWGKYTGKISGDATGGKSNLNMRVYTQSSWVRVEVFAHNSADSIGNGENYSKSFEGLKTLRNAEEDLRLKAIFDEPGEDDVCTAKWDY